MRALAPLLLAAAVLAPGLTHAELENEVKAAYLYRFLSYLEWPEPDLDGDGSPIVIGVVGADGVYDALKDIVQGRSAQGRPIEVRRLTDGDDTLGVHMVFVGRSAAGSLGKLASRKAIVVGEVDGALRRGAAINLLRTPDHVRFEVAPQVAERKGVRISSRMLSVAARVETGAPELPHFLRRSVSRKITALVVLSTLAALTVSAAGLIYYNASEYRAMKLADVRTQAAVVGRAAAPALAFSDPKDAEQDLLTLAERPDVLYAMLYDAQGKLFAFYARPGYDEPVPQRLDAYSLGIHGERLTLAYPIIEDGGRLGTLILDVRYGQRARLLAYTLILGGVTLGALLASLLLSSWLQRAVIEPILSVADAARGVIERRDLSVRARKSTDDEIGILADAMNGMLADLEREMAERHAAEDALRTADRRKDEFLATLAHELRNPLAPIRNALYILRMEGADPAAQAEARAIIDRQVLLMVRLVDDLLEVSRITTGKLRLKRERVELRKVASAALEAVEPIIRERGHRLEVTLPPPGLTIDADPTRLSQVFLNLLNNAAKFTSPHGRIEFALEVRNGEMVARVKDDGVGIAPDMIEPIFEMFAQADRSLERTTMGLGVGLSLSRRLMELHGGTIEAQSAGANRGAEFVVRMPAVSAEMSIHSIETAARVPASEGNGRPGVLLVDDNEDFAISLAGMLRARGYEVRVEHDGLAGLAAAEAFHPAVAFLDIGMPKLNGYELARRMRALPATADAVLIAVTGWGQDEDRARSEQAGFDGHLVKPIDPGALLSLLASISQN